MDRFYRALRGLTIAALALGLFTAGYDFYTNWPSLVTSDTGAQASTPIVQALITLEHETAQRLSFILGSGVCLMGIALSWMDHRKRWFATLLIVTLATNLVSAVVDALMNLFPNRQFHFLDFSTESGVIYFTTITLAPLIAVALTLVFTRTVKERMAVDADLGITRSAI